MYNSKLSNTWPIFFIVPHVICVAFACVQFFQWTILRDEGCLDKAVGSNAAHVVTRLRRLNVPPLCILRQLMHSSRLELPCFLFRKNPSV